MEINPDKIRILIIDDDEGDQFLIEDYLREIKDQNFEISFASGYQEATKLISARKHDIYLVDHYLGEETGLKLITDTVAAGFKKPFILLTGLHSREVDDKAIKAGAYDYLPKDNLSAILLERTIRHSVERYKQSRLADAREKRFVTLFKHSVDPIYITDKSFNIQEINHSFKALFEDEYEHIRGLNLADFFTRDQDFIDLKTQLDDKGYVKDFVVELKQKNKLTALVSIATIYDDEDEELTGFQGVIHDMTELKNAEKRVLVAEKVSLTGRMARMVGHEVRNPLTNINLATDQLKDEIPDSNDEARLFVEMIERNSERISLMIDQLLKGTRVKELEKSNIELADVISKSIHFCEDRFNLKEIATEFENQCASSVISADAEQLEIVFINLLTNAVEAMEEASVRQLKVILKENDTHFVVDISDTGKGMNETTRLHLFEPFFSERSKGLGLGMATVHNLVILHKGKISVESEEGKGTCFHLKFPKTK